ncbi:sensor histidine kinase [Nocardioides pocheonensis]|uniref:histidine kinase n=2 Tax=Nocardioides pocheonensis TaxID=661485 RepID=A0A3N0GQI9_9ACTN|nr:sensor histidine kinase [Nocardioides pocheonensis]
MRSYLTDQLDGRVRDALERADRTARGIPDGPGDGADRSLGQIPGTLSVIIPADSSVAPVGGVLTERLGVTSLPTSTITTLRALDGGVDGQTVKISGTSYRAMLREDSAGTKLVVGLPTSDVDRTINSMLTWFALLTLLGVGIAGAAGTLLVRRQMRPLYAVAETARAVSTQELSTGETAIETRVPQELTDEQSEVGKVGFALNTLLDHIDEALAARHRSEQQVRQFVADASHELRTPLATIHGYAELSRRQLSGDTADDAAALLLALNKVETEADRMGDLVADLLLLARLDSGRPLARAEVDLTRLLLEAVADARVVAPDHKWQLSLPDEPVTVVGDDARLHQVITNLLNNARSHTPTGTTVTVGAAAYDDHVTVTVHDDGPGLPPDLVGEAFDRFTRGDSSRTRASGGAGLGLSLVSAIAEAHGGSAAVTSTPGDTTFTVTLPRR